MRFNLVFKGLRQSTRGNSSRSRGIRNTSHSDKIHKESKAKLDVLKQRKTKGHEHRTLCS